MTTNQPSSGWRLQRAWADGRIRWWTWSASIFLGLCVLGGAWSLHQRARHDGSVLHAELLRLQTEPLPLPKSPSPAAPDFTTALGAPLPAVQVVQELQRACGQAGALLASVQAQERAPSVEQLGRHELAITMRGPYSGTKLVLKQVVERSPNVT